MRGFWPTVVLGLGTYLSRASFILLLADRTVPPRLAKALRTVGPAVLGSLVGAILVGDDGLAGLAPSPEVIALAAATGVAWWTRNMTWTLVAGMVVVWGLGAVWA